MSYVNNEHLQVFKSSGGGLVCATKPIRAGSFCFESSSRTKMIEHLRGHAEKVSPISFARFERELKDFGDIVCDCQWDETTKTHSGCRVSQNI